MDENTKLGTDSNLTDKLDNIKNLATVMTGAAVATGGALTMNPFMVVSGVYSLFGGFLAPYMARNRDKYFESLRLDIERIIAKIAGLNFENILSDERVLSAILQVYPTVLRTHEEEKLTLLRNVVLNTALKTKIDDDLRTMYIQFVSDLTPSHIRILKFFQNPKEWINDNGINLGGISMTSRSTILEMCMPELVGRYDQFVIDMINRGLLPRGEWLHVVGSGFLTPMITPMGNEFLSFVESPLR